MTLQQLRGLCEVVHNGHSVSRAAHALHTSQPAVSKLMRQLESDVGATIFVRSKGRVVGLTSIGEEVLGLAQRVLQDMAALSDLVAERSRQDSGVLKIGTTHFHARHTLLNVLLRFARTYPAVELHVMEGNPEEIVRWVSEGRIHLGVTTFRDAVPDTVMMLPAYPIDRYIITPHRHPLLELENVMLEDLAGYPIIAYDSAYESGAILEHAFMKRGLKPRIAVKASDPNVIKACVAAGLGISVVANMALEPDDSAKMAVVDARHLFPSTHVQVCLRRGEFMRSYAYDFVGSIAPKWTREKVDREMSAA